MVWWKRDGEQKVDEVVATAPASVEQTDAEFFAAQDKAFDLEQSEKYAAYQAADEQDRIASKDWEPEVTIDQGKLTAYICYAGVELPASYIESITVTGVGAPPTMCWFPRWYRSRDGKTTYTYGGANGANNAYDATEASIEVTTISGQKHRVTVSRHKVDGLLAALLKAWRENR